MISNHSGRYVWRAAAGIRMWAGQAHTGNTGARSLSHGLALSHTFCCGARLVSTSPQLAQRFFTRLATKLGEKRPLVFLEHRLHVLF
jgi:hypothetical protein